MWVVITVVGILAIVVLVGVRAVSRPAEEVVPDPQGQPASEGSASADYPEPGSGESPHRPDGSPIPGSEEYRNRHGQN